MNEQQAAVAWAYARQIEKWKYCPGCGQDFKATLQHFYCNNARRDGLSAYCKECSNLFTNAAPSRQDPSYIERNREAARTRHQRIAVESR